MERAAYRRGHAIGTITFIVLLAAPFCLLLVEPVRDPREYAHMGLLVALSAGVALLWRAGVRRWGPSGALLSVAAAPALLVILYGAVLLDLWPTPMGSFGFFVYGFPAWTAALGLLSIFVLEARERRGPGVRLRRLRP